MNCVLAVTDLSAKSDRIVRCGAALAELLNAELQLLHVVELRRRTLREAVPVLQDLETAFSEIERAVQEQAARIVPPGITLPEPLVDFDHAGASLSRNVKTLKPCAVVADASGDAAGLLRLGFPVIIPADAEPSCTGRIVVISHSDALDAITLQRTAHWCDRLTRVQNGARDSARAPDFEVLSLDDGLDLERLASQLRAHVPALVAITAASFEHARMSEARLLSVCSSSHAVPLLVLPNEAQVHVPAAVERVSA